MPENFYNLIGESVRSRPDAIALEADSGESYTYAAFDAWTARYSAWLTARGVRAGDRVLVQADKSAHLLMLCYACIRAGAVFVPINVGARRMEVVAILRDAEPALVVCDPRRNAIYELHNQSARVPFQIASLSAQGRGSAYDEALHSAATGPVAAVDDNAPAALMYTSGTTGLPKAAIITHRNIRANGTALRSFWRWSGGDTLLHALPLYHLHGLFVATTPSLLSGTTILLQRRFSVASAIARLARATVFMGVPTYFTRLLASPLLTRQRCSHMRLFISGSAPLGEQTFHAFRAKTGHEILGRYGLTETGGVACNPVDAPRKSGGVGVPLPGFSLRVAGEAGGEMSDGEVGEVQVSGDSVFPGYWKRPEETAQAFTRDGYFRTGDLGRRFVDGSYEIVGRAKDVIITGGANVNPLEVEAALDGCPGVAESAVIGVPHPDYGEAVVAVVVQSQPGLSETANQLVLNGLLMRLKLELAAYKVPRRIVFRAELPRNAMGKIQKHILRADPDLLACLGGSRLG